MAKVTSTSSRRRQHHKEQPSKAGQHYTAGVTAADPTKATSPDMDHGWSSQGYAALRQAIVAGTDGSLEQGAQQEGALALDLPTHDSVWHCNCKKKSL